MSLEQNFPQASGPALEPTGQFTQEWLAFFRALWNRTGEGPGTDPANIAVLGTLASALSVSNDPQARAAAVAAFLIALRPPAPRPNDDAKLFALSLLRPSSAPAAALEVDDEGTPVDTAVTALNFTGAGVTATQTSPGIVQVDVPAGGGGTVTTTGSPASGNLSKFSGAASITSGDLTGDVTTSGTLATTLVNTAVTPGTYGDATHVGQFTVDAKGRLTFAQNVAISGAGSVNYVPMATGSEPLTFMSNGSGQPMLIPFAP